MLVRSAHKMSRDKISRLNVGAQMRWFTIVPEVGNLTRPHQWLWSLDASAITEHFAIELSRPPSLSLYQMTILVFSAADFICEDTGAPLVCPKG